MMIMLGGFRGSRPFCLFAALVILVDALSPVVIHGAAGADIAHRVADGLVDDGGAPVVGVVIGGPVGGDAESRGLPGRIDVGPQE